MLADVDPGGENRGSRGNPKVVGEGCEVDGGGEIGIAQTPQLVNAVACHVHARRRGRESAAATASHDSFLESAGLRCSMNPLPEATQRRKPDVAGFHGSEEKRRAKRHVSSKREG